MTNLNQVSLVGRLTRDSELKVTNSGVAVLKFTIANNYSTKVNGTWEEKANFLDCVMFGKAANTMSSYLKKGTQVTLGGELRHVPRAPRAGARGGRADGGDQGDPPPIHVARGPAGYFLPRYSLNPSTAFATQTSMPHGVFTKLRMP